MIKNAEESLKLKNNELDVANAKIKELDKKRLTLENQYQSLQSSKESLEKDFEKSKEKIILNDIKMYLFLVEIFNFFVFTMFRFCRTETTKELNTERKLRLQLQVDLNNEKNKSEIISIENKTLLKVKEVRDR